MSSTCVVEEQPQHASHIALETLPRSEQSTNDTFANDSPDGFQVLDKWDSPRINIFRSFATWWSFLVMGANDAAYGVSPRHILDLTQTELTE